MADIKISQLTAAAAALTTQQFEVNEAGTSKRVTGQQILDLVDANLGTLAQQDASSVNISGGSIVGITDLAIADGGTGASNAQAARNNLLPSQTGNANKFLKTDGTNVSWDSTGVADGDRGDITVTGDGTIWTIDTGVVTTSKIADANVTTDKLSATGVTAGAYGSATEIPVVTVDAKGRITNMATESLVISGTLIGYQVFTTSGTYTKATNSPGFVIVEVQGGGGSGGSGNTGGGATPPAYTGGAGGGGGYSRKKILATSLASSETVTVGGVAGTSSFGAHCSASGGTTGTNATTGGNGISGVGGTGSSGDFNRTGSRGITTVTGGASSLGFGGESTSKNGITYGGGGFGGTGSGNSGGTGAAGIVIVWEYK